MATVEDVAREAGLSVATVSRVLNNSSAVRPETAARVRAAIERLGYVPNVSARNLRRNESRAILLLAPNFTNPFYTHVMTGVIGEARHHGYDVLLCSTAGDADKDRQLLEMLHNRRADGAILLACTRQHRWIRRYAERYPLVVCPEYVPGEDVPHVSIDNRSAAYEAVRYLIGLGHRRIGMLSAGNDYLSTHLRVEGYCDALREAGLARFETDFGLASADYSFASGHACAHRILAQPERPTAMFCVSDILALSVISAAQERGIAVPDGLTVVGFDDVDYTTMLHPFLTTVRQPCMQLGEQSMRLLLELMQGRRPARRQLTLPYRLIERESSARWAAR